MINNDPNVKTNLLGFSNKSTWKTLVHVTTKCDETCKTVRYLAINDCTCKIYVFNKLIWFCEDEMANTSETLLANPFNKKSTVTTDYCFLHSVSLIFKKIYYHADNNNVMIY